jgi:hypothetical protein
MGMPVPPVVVTYGASKLGKTGDFLYSVPTAHFLVPALGNLDAWADLTGVKPKEVLLNGFDEILQYLGKLPKTSPDRPTAIVLDDLSVHAERTLIKLDPYGAGGQRTYFMTKRKFLMIRETTQSLGIPLYANAHEHGVSIDEKTGQRNIGGPRLASTGQTADLPHIAHLVLRAVGGFNQPPEWIGRYACQPGDSSWIMGDRYAVVSNDSPMNVREILIRAAETRPPDARPVVPPRAPGLEWLDATAETVARGLTAGRTREQALDWLTTAAKRGEIPSRDPRHLRWAWRDGLARWELRTKGRHVAMLGPFVVQEGQGQVRGA